MEEQVQKLKGRNLEVGDTDQAIDALSRIGYYRLTGYLYPFRQKTVDTKQDGTAQITLLSSYVPGTNLDQIMALIDYDRRLRLLMLDAVERIEVSVRHAHRLCRYKHGEWVSKSPGKPPTLT